MNHFVNGQRVGSSGEETIPVIDPSNGEVFAAIARGTASDVNKAVEAAREAFGGRVGGGPWGSLTALERGRLLAKLAQAVEAHREELVALESRDAGKPTRQAQADVTALARYCEFYGAAADKLHGDTIPYLNEYTVVTLHEPYGVAAQIITWNYPMQVFGRSVMPALAAGNACVVKPSEDACLTVLRMAELAAEAGFPPGTLNVVTGYGHEVGATLAGHPGIDHLSFTGSPEIGKRVSQAAAENHTPAVMELGGKSPQIVFADANLDEALPFIVNAIIQNAGQTCTAGSRLLVQQEVYEQTLELLAERFRSLKVGPAVTDPDVGPLISKKQLGRVNSFLDEVRRDGLPIVATAPIAEDLPLGGYYAAPTLVRDVPAEHRLAQEEVFGPVLAAMSFRDEDHALDLANTSPFGLAAAIWTLDGARQLRLARRVHSGQVFVNTYGAGGGVELPLGGVKHSGYGREKGMEALLGCTRVKTIAIRHG